MYLTEIRISGVRGFPVRDHLDSLVLAGKDETPPSWVVVAGRNGAGKSTLLRAIALTIAGPPVARLLAETFSDWIREGEAEASAAVRLRLTESDRFVGSGTGPKFDPWVALRWSRSDGPEPTVDPVQVGGNWSPIRGPWATNPRGWFVAGYGPFRRLSPAPAEAQRLMLSSGRPSGLASLFREDASLSEAVFWLQQIYLRRLEGDADAQNTELLVLRLLNDGLLPEGVRAQKVDSSGLWVQTPDGGTVALKSVSDGYRTIAGIVLDVVRQIELNFGQIDSAEESDGSVVIDNEGLVLIDEIDVHLHVEWQKRIGFWMKEHFPKIQFIVTTHSPFICQAADEGGLIRLAPPWSNAPSAEVVEGEIFNRVVNGSADEAMNSDIFGLESTLSDPARRARHRLALLEAKSFSEDLDETERSELGSLRDVLPSSHAARAEYVAASVGIRRA